MMAGHPHTLEQVRDAGVLAVVRAESAASAVRACDALVEGGITGLEITYSTPDPPAVLTALVDRYDGAVVLGAGTLRRPEQAAEARAGGAHFLVSPGLDDALVDAMGETGAVVMAGALTPTEVMRALGLKVEVIKVFPAAFGGPAYLRALRGPFPDLPFMPTGGVSPENLGEWLGAGALAVAAGGELCSPADIAAGRFDDIRENAKRFAAALGDARATLAGVAGD